MSVQLHLGADQVAAAGLPVAAFHGHPFEAAEDLRLAHTPHLEGHHELFGTILRAELEPLVVKRIAVGSCVDLGLHPRHAQTG